MAWNWLIYESFDDASYQDRWDTPTGASLVTGPDGRGQALRATSFLSLPLPGSSGVTFTIGVRAKGNALTGRQVLIDGMHGTNVNHFRLLVDETHVYLEEGATSSLLISAPHGVDYNEWNYYEFQGNVNNSGNVLCAVNGTTIFQTTAALWNASSTSARTELHVQNFDCTDLYIHDSRLEADLLGPVYVTRLYPDGNGTNTAWTGDYTDVDDAVASTASYISTTTPAAKESFTFDNLPVGASAVHAVQVEVYGRGDGQYKTLFRSGGGAEANGGTYFHLPEWGMRTHSYETNPVTATAWTGSDVNGYEYGVEAV